MSRRKLLLETFEDRILCSVTAPVDPAADPQPAAPAATTAPTHEPPVVEAAAGHAADVAAVPAAEISRELIVINGNLPEAERLIAELTKNLPGRSFQVVTLDTYRDGVEQITEVLAGAGGKFDAIHLLGHGDAGYINLGATRLDVNDLGEHSDEIARWGLSLNSGADILFYGCSFADGAAGQQIVQRMAQLTGADVAASIDPTGAATMGGNWNLEYSVGAVQSGLGAQVGESVAWTHLLAGTPIDGGIGAFAGVNGNRIYSISFDTGKATLVGTSNYVAAGGTINSLGIDSVNGVVYYADSANASRALYGFDLRTGQQFILAADVTTFGVTLPAAGLGAAGGDFAGGNYYFSTEGGGPGSRDQIFRVNFATGSNGRTIQSITAMNYIDGANEFGDFIVVPGGTTKLWSFNSGTGVEEYNLTGTATNLTSIQRDANGTVAQGALDRSGNLYTVGTGILSYNPAGSGTFGAARTITTNGTTALGALADGSAWVPAEASIGDRVWYDADLDTVQDAGENGVVGLTVSLYDDLNGNGALDGGERLLATTTTGANGAYTFGQLLPGDYLVRVTDPTSIMGGAGSTTGGTTQAQAITLVGQAVTNKDFGFEQPATITVSSPAVTEGTNAFAVFTVSLSNRLQNAVNVNLALANGSATGGGTDFGPGLEVSTDGGTTWTSGTTATIAAGTTSVLVRTPVANDALDEAAENFTLTATRTSGLTANTSGVGTATITDDDPAPALTIGNVTVNEAAGTATFTVTLNTASGQAVSVNYATSNGTATAGADYTSTSGTLNFAAGVTSQTIVVAITNDTIFENSEAFNVTLTGAVNATIATATGVGTIRDDGTGAGGTNNDTPTLSVSSPAVTEGTDSFAVFTVALSNASTTAVTLGLALTAGTAAGGGTDFGAGGATNLQVSTDGGTTWNNATTVIIAAGTTSVLVRTPITNDALDEAAETFTLTATRTAGTTTNGNAAGTATITDDDPTPSLVINDVTVNEAAGTATFTVTLSAASGRAVSVNYGTSNGTATAGGDYASTSGTLNFAAGVTVQTITVNITNDAIFESSESFNVNLSGAVNATIADNLGVGTIRDDGTGPGGTDNDTPTLSVSSPTVTEGTNAFAIFTVGLSNAATTAVNVNLALANGATGEDFGPGLEVSTDGGVNWTPASSATIAAGSTSVLARTPITNDAVQEATEAFNLTATRTAGPTTNASAIGTTTINDDDAPPTLTINDVTVNEAAGTATFTVTLSAASGQAVSVGYGTSNGTATAGADYTTTSGTLNFAAGVTSQTITVSIANDAVFENSESFNVTLSGAVNATIADNLGVGTIRDDGTGAGGTNNDTPTLSVSSPTVTEGTNPFAVFTVALSNASTTAVSVNLALANGTASGADYGPGLEVSTNGGTTWTSATAATIAAGTTSVLVRTPVTNDALDEAAETFTLTATRTAGTTTNAGATGTTTIVDDDATPSFVINDVTVNEAAGTATFTVTLGAPSGQATAVNYATSSGTATSGTDFTATSGTLNFAAGVTTQTITVAILNDAVFENSESFNVTLSGAVNATITDNLGLGTIRDDGTGTGGTNNDTPTLSVSSPTVTEGANAFAVFTVALSNLSTTAVNVSLALANGTASGGGTDFGGGVEVSTDGGTTWTTASTATIAAGTANVLVRTPITNDALDEATETFTLIATRTSGTTTNGSATGTGTIVDDDLAPSLAIDDVTVNEAAGTMTFTVSLNTPSGQPLSVNYATNSGSATSGSDFTAASGTLTFAAGVTSQTITVTIANDTIYEVSESFNVTLSGAVNATIADTTGLGTIRDDGTGAGGTDNDIPTLTVSSPTVTEGTDGFAIFTVGLSNASTTPVTALLALTAGSATGGGTDFGPTLEVSTDGGATWTSTASATIPAGSTAVLVRTLISDDAVNEGAEAFTLTATRTSGTSANSSATGTATIVDNDTTPALTINDLIVNEGVGTATFTVTLSAASGLPVSVNYGTSSGTATSGVDFTASAGALTFAPGVTSQTITVPITNDSVFESSETFNIVLSSATNAGILDQLGVATIRDDGTGTGGLDNDTPAINVSSLTVTEGTDAHAVFSVGLSNPSTTPVVVSLALANGTALGGGVDFGGALEVSTDGGATWNAASTATIAAGTTSVLVRTPITNDVLNEAAETFTLTATRTGGTTTNSAATGTATIQDNDALPSFTINDVTVNEAAGVATFTVTLNAVSGRNVAVSYTTSDGTAVSGADYATVTGTLNFAAGVTSQTISVPIVNDTTYEGSEGFSVTLSGAVNATITDNLGLGTVRDDGTGAGGIDNDTPSLSVSNVTVTEGTNPHAIFAVSLSNVSTTPVNVSLALAAGTATGGGVDFGAGLEVSTDGGVNWTPASTATIAAGASSVLVRTPVVNDTTTEATEDFTLTATRTSGATTNASAVGTGTIQDNDAAGSLTTNDVTVNEAAGTATFTVTLSAPSAFAVTVNYATNDGSALAGSDFTNTSGALNFAPGETTRTITVPITNDAIYEGSENFTVVLSGSVNASIADGTGVGTIRDDGTGAGGADNDAPTLSVGNVTVTEGTDAYAIFTVSLSNASTTAVTTSLALANGTATGGGTDFGAGLEVSTNGGGTWLAASSVAFAPGATSVLVRTPIMEDALGEAAETFTLTATRTSGTTANPAASGTATIVDNDTPPAMTINDVVVNEAAGTATFTVLLNTASGRTVTVDYATNSGTATAGADFTGTSGTLIFLPGVTSQTVTVTIANDPVFEGAETYTVLLSGAVNGTIGDGSGLGTIRDDGPGAGGTDDDRPVNTLPPTFSTAEDGALILSGIGITNPDPSRTVTVTLAVGSGVLNFSTGVSGGVTAGQVTGNGTGSVTLTASVNAINATLADAAGVQYVPAADFHGALPLTLTTQDGLGTDSDPATITVTPVADIVNDNGTTDEDTPITIAVLANDTFDDPGAAITAVDGQAITAGGPAVAVFAGTVSLDGLGQLTYTPAADYQGPTSFTYTVSAGGATETATVNITVNSVDDPLAISAPTLAAATEDTQLVFSAANGNGLVIDDSDGGLISVTLAVQYGTLTLSQTTNLTLAVGDGVNDVTFTILGLATDINAALEGLVFTPIADYNGPALLSMSAADVASAAPNLINGGFEQPGGLSGSTQVNEAGVDGWETSASDNLIEIWRTGFLGVPAFQGQQFAEINATQDATLSQTVNPLTGGTLKFSFAHRGRAGVDTINVQVTDLGLDGVAGGGDDTVILSENFSDGTAAWGYYERTLVSSAGNPILVEFTSVSTAAGNPSVGNFIDGVFFGLPNDVTSTAVTINVAAVADVLDDSATTAEDTPVALGVLANDSFENPGRTITAVNGNAITAGGPAVNVPNGTVALNGSEQLVFTPSLDYTGPANFTYTVTSNGTTETASVTVTVTAVTDPPTVDLDTTAGGTGSTAIFTENGASTPVVGATVGIADVDSATLGSATVVLTNAQPGDALAIFGTLPPGLSGAIDTSVAGLITVTLTGTATPAAYQTALQQIQFSNSSENPPTVARTITVQVNDGGLDSNVATAVLNVVAVNDAPGVTLPPAQSVAPGNALAVTGISFTDVDAAGGTVTVTLAVNGGTLTVATGIGGGVTAGEVTGNGTGTVSLTATLAAINATLADGAGLIYVSGTSGNFTLAATISDQGNSGVDPATLGQPNTGTATDEVASGTVAITVTPPAVAIGNVSVTEGADPYAIFTVSLSNPAATPVTVALAIADGTAAGGDVDFGSVLEVSTDGGSSWAPAAVATIAAGETSVLVRTAITNDALDEVAENFSLSATVTAGTTTNASATGIATIADDDATPALAINDVTVNEAAGTVTFTVTLSAASGQVVTVDHATGSGTATSGTDFTGTAGTLTFAAGVTSQTITVPVLNDATYEGSESFTVLLSAAANATVADGTGVGTILDDGTGGGGTDNDLPSLSVSNVTVTEGVDAHAVFAVSLSNPATTAVAVSLALANGTAIGGGEDFGAGLEVSTDGGATWTAASTATIAAGSTSVLVRTPIVNDALAEAAEIFNLTATQTSGPVSNAAATGVATIVDTDAAPALSINDVTLNEAAGTATFTVTLTAPSGQTVAVSYATSNGTATAGNDFLAGTGTLIFAAGVTTQTITVPILNDAIFEQSENFTVTLASVVNATITDGTGIGTILDDGTGGGGFDDDTPSVQISNVIVTEGTDSHAVFSVALSNLSTTPVTLALALVSGTATSGADFGVGLEVSTDGGTTWTAAASATIAAGSTSVLVRTPIADDPLNETPEDFTLNATVTSGTTRNASVAGIASILDNDGPPAFSVNDVTVNEGAGTATFTVTLSSVSGQAVRVDYATSNGTALAGADFASAAGTLVFGAGVTSQTITVAISNDAVFEGSESFFVLLSGEVNAGISDDTGVGTILDNGTGPGGTDNDTPTLSVSNVTVTEGADSHAIFTVSLSNLSTTNVNLSLGLVAGSATGGGTDFGAGVEVSTDGGTTWIAGSSATIAAGTTSALVRTPINDDAIDELGEDFTLTATVTGGTTVNVAATGTATIADDDATPTLSIDDVTVNEAAGTATFTVTLSAASGLPVSVAFATSNGTATAGVDFTGASGTLNFAAGVTSQTITVAITNDALFEQSESFNVLLSAPVNATVADGSGAGTILDDGTGTGGSDNDTPTLSVGNVSVIEGTDAFAVFAVTLSNASTTPVNVDLALANGTATGGGTDFGVGLEVSTDGGTTWVPAAGATLAPGSTSVLVRTPVTDDALDEASEDFTLTATVATGVTTNAAATGTATIADDDATPTLSIDDVTVNEAAGTATFTVTLSAASGLPVSVNFATSNGTATGADFTSASGTLNFAAGVTSQTITVAITNDALFEQSESFNVLLSAPVNATVADGSGAGTILDDGTGTGGSDNDTPTLSVGNVSVIEGTDAYAVFAVTLSNASATPVNVNLALANGTATGGGTDFGAGLEVSTDGGATWVGAASATLAPGSTSVLVRTPVTNDALDELSEDFTLAATVATGVTTNAAATGTATIADDDATPTLSIDDVTVNEAAGTATFTVTLSAASGLPVSVNYATSNGTATGADFTGASGTLNFAAGVTSQTITIAITNDALFELSENFNVLLSAPLNATIADATGLGTILDNGTGAGGTDNDTPTVNVSNVSVIEGTNPHAVFAVSLSNPSTTAVSVSFALGNGTATGAGVDFGAGLEVSTDGGTTWVAAVGATFAPGDTSVLVRTPINNDTITEGTENFTLTASVTAGTTSNALAIGTGTIFDDDAPPTLSIDDLTINESAGTATFTVTLSAPSGFAVDVNYTTAGGTALGGADFTATSGTLNFAPGVLSQTVTVAITNDALFENREAFSVVLSGAVNATIADDTGVTTVVDDDVRQGSMQIVGTSDAGSTGNQVVVGEVVTYELKLELAEGANAGMVLHDLLPAGMQFLANAAVVVGYENAGTSVTGQAAGSFTNLSADALISASLTADDDAFVDGTPVFFKLGALTNNDSDADREYVTIRFSAVTTNTAANQAGALHDNTFAPLLDIDGNGTSGYVSIDRDGDNAATGTEVANDALNDGSGSPGVVNTVTTQVAEPILVLDKQITNAPAVIKVGDTIVYTVTISHAVGSGGTAWEATLADSVPAGLQLAQIDSVTLAGGAQEQVAATIGGGGQTIGGVWDVPVGGSVTVVYRATVTDSAVLGATLNNVGDVTWSSLDGSSAGERDGSEGLLSNGVLNDYQLLGSASATIDGGASDFALVKTVVGDNNAEIGERLTYQLTLKVADGIINSVSLRDLVPTGFVLINGSAQFTTGAGVTVSGAAFTYAANQLTLDIAQLQSAADGVANTITITYSVDVLDTAANDAFGGAGTVTKTNTADAGYDPGSGLITASGSATVSVVEPVITASEQVTSAPAKPNAGDTITFQVVIGHGAGSTGNAYNVVYTDTLPAEFANVQLTGISGTAGTLPALADFTLFGNTILTVNPFDLGLGENVVLTYTAVIQDTVTPGDVLTNNAIVTAQSTNVSPSGNTRSASSPTNAGNYQATGTATLVADATFDVAKIANVSTAKIGDRIRYTITVKVIEGTTPDLMLADALPGGPAIDPGSIQIAYGAPGMNSSNASPASIAGNTLTFDFATLTNPGDNDAANDTITIEYDAVVSDNAGNNNGDVKTNLVSGTYTGLLAPVTASAGVTVVEPVLDVQKTVDDSTPHLGQTVTYTLVVTHNGTSTASAFDLTLNDPLPAGVSLNAGSIQLANAPAGTTITSNTSTNGGALQLALNQLALGESVTITFTATVTTDPAVIGGTFGGGDDSLSSTVALGYDTQAGSNPDQRALTDAAGNTLTVVGADLAVTVDDGQATATAGSRLTYTITVTNNGTDTATNVVLSDMLPAGGTFNVGLSTAGATLVGGKVVYNLPTLAAGATATFEVVVDLASPTAAGVESVTSVVDVAHGDVEPTPVDNTASDTDTLLSVPDYRITVTDNRTSAKPGETVNYVITVTNVGNQDGAGVIVSDVFSTGIFSAVTVDQGGVVDLANGTVVWNVGNLAVGETVTLALRGTVNATFTAIAIPSGTVPGAVPDNDAIGHTLEVADDGLGGADANPADNIATDLDDLQPVPELRVTMTDHVTIAKPGQTLTYTIVATNAGLQDSNGMVVIDRLPKGVTLVRSMSSDPALTGTPVISGGKITWTFTGPVPAGTSITFRVVVKVNANVEPGSALLNRVSIADDGLYGPDAVTTRDNASTDTDRVPDAIPTPTPEPPPTAPAEPAPFVFAFDTFRNFSTNRTGALLPVGGPLPAENPIDMTVAPLLPLMPIYSGSADPGATLVISLYNARGEQIGVQTVIADAGGNWLAAFASSSTRDIPNSVQITQIAAPVSAGESWGHNLRTNYSPALNPGQFFFQTLQGSTLGDEEAPLLGGLGLENPLQLGSVKYAGELLGAAASASGY